MIETNATKSVAFAKKGLKWGLYAALVGAVIGLFVGCMTARETVYDSIGPCLSGQVEYYDSVYHQYSSQDIPANRTALLEQGYKISGCDRKATASEKSDSAQERALGGLVIGAICGAVVGCSLPWLAAGWFFFLMLLGQVFGTVRAEPIRAHHRVTVKKKSSNKQRQEEKIKNVDE